MTDTELKPIDGQMDFISFKELVEHITGDSFEKVYDNYILHGANNEQSDLE